MTLSPRRTQVMDLMCDGLSNAEIAGRLGLSEHTVRNTVTDIYRVLGVSSRGQAMSLWVRHPDARAESALVNALDALQKARRAIKAAHDAVREKE